MAGASGHGGARKGAGRKAGGVNRRTRELTEDALDRIENAAGKLPIEVMYEVMQAYRVEWLGNPKQLDLAERAAHWADKCAPYFHARLSSIDVDLDSAEGVDAFAVDKPPPPDGAEKAAE